MSNMFECIAHGIDFEKYYRLSGKKADYKILNKSLQ